KEKAIEDAYLKILSIAESVGYSVEDLLNVGAANAKKKNRKIVEPRYRSKTNSQDTWTGRGKQPRWLVAEIEKGANLEDFRIN
ncbi:H-NS histone family protein, partial [Acinetobacter baumannii]|nr:H-NS histone family protein [Acinetobacter baumannii]